MLAQIQRVLVHDCLLGMTPQADSLLTLHQILVQPASQHMVINSHGHYSQDLVDPSRWLDQTIARAPLEIVDLNVSHASTSQPTLEKRLS